MSKARGDEIRKDLERALQERILVLDGAMGTTIRGYGLDEAAARGDRFADNEKDLLNVVSLPWDMTWM